MAYATLLTEGYPVRLSGEDCRRGTFYHRHAAFFSALSYLALLLFFFYRRKPKKGRANIWNKSGPKSGTKAEI